MPFEKNALVMVLFIFILSMSSMAIIETTRPRLTALGDSITLGRTPENIGRPFPSIVGDALAYNVTNLGIGQMTSSGLLDAELHKIPHDTKIILIYVGTNDVHKAISDQKSEYDLVVSNFRINISSIIASAQSVAVGARIVVATIPNVADTYVAVGTTDNERAKITSFINNMNDVIVTGAKPRAVRRERRGL